MASKCRDSCSRSPIAAMLATISQFDERSAIARNRRSEEHTSELQSLMRISYAVFCLKKKNNNYKYRYKTLTSYSTIDTSDVKIPNSHITRTIQHISLTE